MTNVVEVLVNRSNTLRDLMRNAPGFFANKKHDLNKDFGYPDHVTFELAHDKYRRNGLATAAVDRTRIKTWETFPTLKEADNTDETAREQEIRQKFDDLRFWQVLAEADKRSMVGGFAGVILRFADSQPMREPVGRVNGLDGLVEVIPAWEGQITVANWDEDEMSETYGRPSMFSFNESSVKDEDTGRTRFNRSFDIHPSRMVVWSNDGTIHNRSALEPGFNSLLDMEKIVGAGGQGFWKNAKSSPVLETDPSVRLQDMAKALGVEVDGLADKMDEQVKDWSTGFDSMLMLQGIQAKMLNIDLPDPENFFAIALQVFCASIPIPQKVLLGMQTGERASTEDAREWAQICSSRRINSVIPNIHSVIRALEVANVLPDRDWGLDWEDLTEATMEQKIERASKMSDINSRSVDDDVFSADEIRETVGFQPFSGRIRDEADEGDIEDLEPRPEEEDEDA